MNPTPRATTTIDGALQRATPQSEDLAFLRFQQVASKTGLRRTKIYALIGERRFPAPYKIPGSKGSFWLSSEVDQWIRDVVAASSQEVA